MKRCLGCMEHYEDSLQVCPHCGYVEGTPVEEAIHMEPGTLLHDRYIVGKVLGYGGFGVTYIGWDGKLEQKVAIKEYLPGEFSTRMPGQSQITVFNGDRSEQFRDGLKKFVEEAKRLAKFQNEPGIVKIFDSFEENETAYIIMEYLDGITLKQYLEQVGTIPENDAVNMLMPIMESLQAVHAEGMLHRDIAPDNIFLTTTGEVKLIDFGASRYATTSHSRSLTVIIKPGYSPEEQYRSRGDQGAYTDVYAIAATIYRMITGKTPPDAMERRAKYENQNKDILTEPHKITKNISRSHEVAILNAMNVRVEDRTPDLKTFIKELNSDPPAKRVYGKIKKIDIYSWPIWLKVLIPSVLSLAIVVGVLTISGVINFKSAFSGNIEGLVSVPDIIGDSEEEARNEREFKDGDLVLKFGVKKIGDEDEDIIIEQNPAKGNQVIKGSSVTYNKSAGSAEDYEAEESADGTITFKKDYDGFKIDDKSFKGNTNVEEYLSSLGLIVRSKEEYSSDYPTKGTIIRIETANGGTLSEGSVLNKGDTVTIVYSKGEQPIPVPDVTGKTVDEAYRILVNSGFSAIYQSPVETDDFAPDTVTDQYPLPGESVSPDYEITLYYATVDPLSQIPNVKGYDKTSAKNVLGDFDVEIQEEYSSSVEKGFVIEVYPSVGSYHYKGDTVLLTVSKGPQPVKVNYEYNGATTKNGANSDTKYYEKTYGTLPTPEKNGYTFSGWYTSNNYGTLVTSNTVVYTSSEHTLYAYWTRGEYTVSFDTAGGSYVSNIGVSFDQPYGSLPTPTKSGYKFNGWYTSDGTRVTENTTVKTSSDHTLYARWSESTYTVYFDANGGSVSTTSKSVTYQGNYGTLPTPTRDYYTFQGWYTSSSGGSKVDSYDSFNETNNITLYAQWSLNPEKGWVLESSVDTSTCDITQRSYTYTETKESTNSKEDGWETYTSWKWGDYGEWKVTTSKPSAQDGREIKEYEYTYWYKRYKYYNSTDGNYYYSWGESWANSHNFSGKWEYKSSNTEMTFYKNYTENGKTYKAYGTASDHWWQADCSKQGTEHTVYKVARSWKYRDKAKIYTYQRTIEYASSYPTGSNVNNIKTYVKYREK